LSLLLIDIANDYFNVGVYNGLTPYFQVDNLHRISPTTRRRFCA